MLLTHAWRATLLTGAIWCANAGLTGSLAWADPQVQAPAPMIDEELRCEILYRKEVDQTARLAAIQDGLDIEALQKINREIDIPNTERMKQIIAQHGWPGNSLIAKDGASAAWLIVQHATHDVPFMEQCLTLMTAAAEKGEASRKELALLIDRVRIRQGKKQLYGTQFRQGSDGQYVAEPIEDESHLDERRQTMGLSTMADEIRGIRQTYQSGRAKPMR
jgi:hypothetical protein